MGKPALGHEDADELLGGSDMVAVLEDPKISRAAMKANNSQWLQAYNNRDAQTLGKMYAEDAILIAAGGQPI